MRRPQDRDRHAASVDSPLRFCSSIFPAQVWLNTGEFDLCEVEQGPSTLSSGMRPTFVRAPLPLHVHQAARPNCFSSQPNVQSEATSGRADCSLSPRSYVIKLLYSVCRQVLEWVQCGYQTLCLLQLNPFAPLLFFRLSLPKSGSIWENTIIAKLDVDLRISPAIDRSPSAAAHIAAAPELRSLSCVRSIRMC
jgi:hypothetical protein